MRFSVRIAPLVWSVANTRWPVSAAVSASEIVSRSRSSPITITSGSSRRAERAPERAGVRADGALVHRAALRRVLHLDRILDGEDVLAPLLVDQVDQRGERRRLAAVRGSGDQQQSLVIVRELGEAGRQP